MSTPVVVGVDGTGRSLRAVMWAAHDAFLRARPLRIVHTLPRYEMDIPLFPPGRFELAEEHGRAVIAEAVAIVRQAYPDVPCSTALPMRSPAAALIEESARAQGIVLGSKGDNVGNLLLGSTALQVVGHADCPVIVVGHVSAGHNRIVAGADGSPGSTAALAYAFEEAHLRGADLHVISALGLPQGWPTHLLRPLPEDNAEVDVRHQVVEQQLASLRHQHPGVNVVLSAHRLDPLAALDSASQHADLLVLGSRGLGGFHGLAIGSTTHKMLHFANCPVAVVRATSRDIP
ncbi:universal stress protein [Nocardioides sp.]|uniref:universal stress protein n=1 Tax=Nocardioides sp. TaxID=35761 RepID=UPI003D0BA60D